MGRLLGKELLWLAIIQSFLFGQFALGEFSPEAMGSQFAEIEELHAEGQFKIARLKLASIEKDLDQLTSSPELYIEYYLQSGLNHFYSSDFDSALVDFKIVRLNANQHGLTSTEAFAIKGMGNCFSSQGHYEEAIESHLKALAKYKSLDTKLSMASSLNNIGIQYFNLGNFEAAEQNYREGLALLDDSERGRRLSAKLASNLAESLIRMEDFDEAEDLLFQSLELELKFNNPIDIAYTYYNLGELYLAKQSFDSAYENFVKAEEIQKKNGHRFGVLQTYLRLAELFHQTDRPQAETIAYGQKAFELAIDLNSGGWLYRTADLLAEVYSKNGEVGRVDFYKEVSAAYRDHIQQEDPSENETTPNLANQIEATQNEASTTLYLQQILIGILVLIFVGLILENRRLRQKR